MQRVCAIVLTKNEEQDLPRCLAALTPWLPVLVLDSGSFDRTVEIAQAHGAKTFSHPFQSFGDQRNWALQHLTADFDWVLFLDADEVSTPAFRSAVHEALRAADPETAGFYCCWKMFLGQRWLKRCDAFPKWQFRLVRKGFARFTDFGHGQKEDILHGRAQFLREPYLHFAFSKGWTAWLERHNRYSTLEARERLAQPTRWRSVFTTNSSQRNKALKPLVSRLPAWPVLRFFADYLVRLGCLEGAEGLTYCVNMAYYEFLIQIKMRELKAQGSQSSVP